MTHRNFKFKSNYFLQIANDSHTDALSVPPPSLETKLSEKEMEIQILLALGRCILIFYIFYIVIVLYNA